MGPPFVVLRGVSPQASRTGLRRISEVSGPCRQPIWLPSPWGRPRGLRAPPWVTVGRGLPSLGLGWGYGVSWTPSTLSRPSPRRCAASRRPIAAPTCSGWSLPQHVCIGLLTAYITPLAREG